MKQMTEIFLSEWWMSYISIYFFNTLPMAYSGQLRLIQTQFIRIYLIWFQSFRTFS